MLEQGTFLPCLLVQRLSCDHHWPGAVCICEGQRRHGLISPGGGNSKFIVNLLYNMQ